MRPRLPTSEQLLPYLRLIDKARRYSNWGPLVTDLERRLCSQFSVPTGSVTSANSGTTALVGAILGTAGRAAAKRPLAVMPSFTFVGTAVAAEHCGYAPYFVDVDPADWILDPLALANHQLRDRTGVVIPVAAFGRPVRAAAWQRFRRDTHIPVVIDGAACFEALTSEPDALIADVPVAVSFHATKSFGVGEGGCVVSRDAALIERVARALNFGFSGSRISSGASANGKMSEYHAAVGLAALDVWSETQASLRRVADEYRSQFADANLQDRFVGAPTVAGCYALFQSASATEAKHVRQCLTAANVDFRLWYGEGLHRQPAFADAGHDDMPTTGTLAEHILGLPAAVDLTSGAISRVVAAIIEAVAVDINAL